MSLTTAHLIGLPASVATKPKAGFWGRWVLANAAGELAGLGTVALIAWTLTSSGDPQTLLQHILFALVLIAAGAFEGAVVGTAQAWVLTRWLPELRRWDWVQATFQGSLVAWLLGMLPSTILSGFAEGSAPSQPELNPIVGYGLAALLGVVTGILLSLFQWRVLRRHLGAGGGWLAVNATAWALGMPLVFLGADLASRVASTLSAVGIVVATLVLTGALVGAVHGLWLNGKLRRLRTDPAAPRDHISCTGA
jgi:hypothetical protein